MQRAELRATRDQIKRFKKSFLWADMVKELEEWKKGFEKANEALVVNTMKENLTSASVLVTMGEISGISKAIDRMLFMPDVFLSLLGGEEDD